MCILLKCKVSRMESEMEVSGVSVEERKAETRLKIYIYSLVPSGSLGSTF